MICGQPLGGIVSALVGQTIAAKYGWQSLFVVGGALTVLVVPLLMLGLPETKPATAGARSARMPTLQALFGEGRAPASLLLWAVFILTLALLSVLLSWTPLLVMGKGLPKPVGLNAIIAINVGGIVGGLVISRLIDRWGVRWPMLSLYVITGVSLYLFARVQSETMLLLVAGFVGLGVLGAQFSLYGIAPRLYPLAGRGSGVGVAVAMGRIGSILGPVVIGGLISRGSTESETVMVMAPVGLTAGVALVLLTLAARQALAAGARAH
jgi:AAHS family 3-hydroxyphenylpropionic acid transporter